MAGHSKWANIQHRKGRQDEKRGAAELNSLWADKVLLVLICWAFSGAIYTAATGASQELRKAPVAVVDEDQSPLSRRLVGAFEWWRVNVRGLPHNPLVPMIEPTY